MIHLPEYIQLKKHYHVDIQNAFGLIPFTYKKIRQWAYLPLTLIPRAEITIRFVTNDTIQQLNNTYRQKNKPTNILAFQNSAHIPMTIPFLGDLIIAPQVLYKEYPLFQVPLETHWAHIIIHGILHLLGYNHEKNKQASIMQKLEQHFLAQLHGKGL